MGRTGRRSGRSARSGRNGRSGSVRIHRGLWIGTLTCTVGRERLRQVAILRFMRKSGRKEERTKSWDDGNRSRSFPVRRIHVSITRLEARHARYRSRSFPVPRIHVSITRLEARHARFATRNPRLESKRKERGKTKEPKVGTTGNVAVGSRIKI